MTVHPVVGFYFGVQNILIFVILFGAKLTAHRPRYKVRMNRGESTVLCQGSGFNRHPQMPSMILGIGLVGVVLECLVKNQNVSFTRLLVQRREVHPDSVGKG